jgi:hypothetical protein
VSLARLGGNSDVYVYEGEGGQFTIHTGNKARGRKFEPCTWTVHGRQACEKKLRELVILGARVPDYVFERLWEDENMHSFLRGPVSADPNSDGWSYNVFDAEKNRIAICFKRDDAQAIVDSLNNCEVIVGVSNVTELVMKGEVEIDGQVLRLHGDAMCDEGPWLALRYAAEKKRLEVLDPETEK